MINQIENESTLRYLRKKHKDWSEERLKIEAKRIWGNYVEENRERLEKMRAKDVELFNECVDREFRNLLMGD